ncbi:ribosomal RNA-processing 7 protein isoform X2 [Tasmannia lanceolata]
MKLKKRKSIENGDFSQSAEADQIRSENEESQTYAKEEKLSEADRRKKNSTLLSKKKRKKENGREVDVEEGNDGSNELKDKASRKLSKSSKKEAMKSKKRKSIENGNFIQSSEAYQIHSENEDSETYTKEDKSSEVDGGKKNSTLSSKKKRKKEKRREVDVEDGNGGSNGLKLLADKSMKAGKSKRNNQLTSEKETKPVIKKIEVEEDGVYHLSSGDEDWSKGMKKWLTEYRKGRPGLEILQQRIDDYITSHETQEEKVRNEREALAAEGGWTVVVHHKGRKKTTDSESGITVGSVAQAVVVDKMGKKKSKVALDFYNFQRREAKRNEIMMLQSKFEQDKKRIQQMRAARKFKPY